MAKPVFNREHALEDSLSDELVISFGNGTNEWHAYRGGLIRFRERHDGRFAIEIYGLSKGVIVYVPQENLPPEPPVTSFWLSAMGGAYLVSNGRVAGFIDYSWLHPGLVELLEGDFASIGRTRQWQEDVDGYANYLAHLSAQSGIPEREVLQQLLSRGRLGQQRSRALRELETKMFQPGMMPRVIGDNIKRVREARGLSVEELAEHSGIDEFEVLAFEGGLEVIFADELVRLAAVLGVEDPVHLLEESGPA